MSVSLEQIGFVHDCANDDSGNLSRLTPITSSIDNFINYCTEKTVLNLEPFMLKKGCQELMLMVMSLKITMTTVKNLSFLLLIHISLLQQ